MTLPKRSLSGRQKLLLGAAGAVVGLAVIVRGLLPPLMGRIASQRAALRELRANVEVASSLVRDMPSAQESMERTQERYRMVEERLGPGQSLARVLEALSQQAKRHRLELVAVQAPNDERTLPRIPLDPETRLREVPLDLTITGRYRPIGEFLGGLVQAPFLSSVRSLRLTKSETGGQELHAKLVLGVYLADASLSP